MSRKSHLHRGCANGGFSSPWHIMIGVFKFATKTNHEIAACCFFQAGWQRLFKIQAVLDLKLLWWCQDGARRGGNCGVLNCSVTVKNVCVIYGISAALTLCAFEKLFVLPKSTENCFLFFSTESSKQTFYGNCKVVTKSFLFLTLQMTRTWMTLLDFGL
jgi:hypothetical protein